MPGLAEQIVKMAENQNAHRIDLESRVIPGQLAQSNRGQIFGFIIALICIIGGIYLGLNGKEVVATALVGTTVIGLVAIFIKGKAEQRQNLKKKI